MFGSQPRTWDNLYKVFEIVEEDVGGLMFRNAWAKKWEIARFTQTASHYRHGKAKYRLPKQPVSLPDAEALITRLLKRWPESQE